MVKITQADVSQLILYDKSGEELPFDCGHDDSHVDVAKGLVARAINELIAVSAFRAQINDFLPKKGSKEKALLNITVTDHTLVVEKLGEEDEDTGEVEILDSKEIDLEALDDSDDSDAIIRISERLINKVDRVYNTCMAPIKRPAHRSAPPPLRTRHVRHLDSRFAASPSPRSPAHSMSGDSTSASDGTGARSPHAFAIDPPRPKGKPAPLPRSTRSLGVNTDPDARLARIRSDLAHLERNLHASRGANKRLAERVSVLTGRNLGLRRSATRALDALAAKSAALDALTATLEPLQRNLRAALEEVANLQAQLARLRDELSKRPSPETVRALETRIAATQTELEQKTKAVQTAEAEIAAVRSLHETSIRDHKLLPYDELTTCLQIADALESRPDFGPTQPTFQTVFQRALSPGTRREVFFHMYEIHSKAPEVTGIDRWKLGEKYFLEPTYNSITATNASRAEAIRMAVMRQLATYYQIPRMISAEERAQLLEIYKKLPPDDRNRIELQLWALHDSPLDRGDYYGHNAFYGASGCSATDTQRGIAILKHCFDKTRSYT